MANIGNLRVRLSLETSRFQKDLAASKQRLREFSGVTTAATQTTQSMSRAVEADSRSVAAHSAAELVASTIAVKHANTVIVVCDSYRKLDSCQGSSRRSFGQTAKSIASASSTILGMTTLAASAAAVVIGLGSAFGKTTPQVDGWGAKLRQTSHYLSDASTAADFAAGKIGLFGAATKIAAQLHSPIQTLTYALVKDSTALRNFFVLGSASAQMSKVAAGAVENWAKKQAQASLATAKSAYAIQSFSGIANKHFPTAVAGLKKLSPVASMISKQLPTLAKAAMVAGASITLFRGDAEYAQAGLGMLGITGKQWAKTVVAGAGAARAGLRQFSAGMGNLAYQAFRVDDVLDRWGQGLQQKFKKPIRLNLDEKFLKRMTMDQLRGLAREIDFPVKFRAGKNMLKKSEIVSQFLSLDKDLKNTGFGAAIGRTFGRSLSGMAVPLRMLGQQFANLGQKAFAGSQAVGGALRRYMFPSIAGINGGKQTVSSFGSTLR